LTGEVVVDLFTDQTSRLDPGTVLSGPGGEASWWRPPGLIRVATSSFSRG